MKKEDLTGQKFGRLTVLELDKERNKEERERKRRGEIKTTRRYWRCKCDCGNIVSTTAYSLNNGQKSCGCLSREMLIERNKSATKKNVYEDCGEYMKGWDTKHENYFLIDKKDYELVSQYCWSKVKGTRGYTLWHACKKDVNKTNIKLHQLIIEQINNSYGSNEKIIIDHISNELTVDKTDDNRRCNLRLTTQSQNNRNRAKQSNNTSGKIGVRFVKKTNKWVARIYNNEHKRISKTFNTYEEAVEQRVLWEKEFGYIGA